MVAHKSFDCSTVYSVCGCSWFVAALIFTQQNKLNKINDRYQRISFSQSPTGSLVSRHVNSSEEAKNKMLSLHSQFFLKLSLGIDKEVISFGGISRPCQFIDTLP